MAPVTEKFTGQYLPAAFAEHTTEDDNDNNQYPSNQYTKGERNPKPF